MFEMRLFEVRDAIPLEFSDDSWEHRARHWRVILDLGGRSEKFDYYQGYFRAVPPTISDVLYLLCMDAQTAMSGYLAYCDVCGVERDHIKSVYSYNRLCEQTDRFMGLIEGIYDIRQVQKIAQSVLDSSPDRE